MRIGDNKVDQIVLYSNDLKYALLRCGNTIDFGE